MSTLSVEALARVARTAAETAEEDAAEEKRTGVIRMPARRSSRTSSWRNETKRCFSACRSALFGAPENTQNNIIHQLILKTNVYDSGKGYRRGKGIWSMNFLDWRTSSDNLFSVILLILKTPMMSDYDIAFQAKIVCYSDR